MDIIFKPKVPTLPNFILLEGIDFKIPDDMLEEIHCRFVEMEK